MKLAVLTPVFNDWESLSLLLKEIQSIGKNSEFEINRIVIVNDGSQEVCPDSNFENQEFEITILNLTNNMGHQRSISIGLCYLNENTNDTDFVIVMDSDGEDKPEDIINLVQTAKQNPSKIIFAKRNKRSEGVVFRLFYFMYRIIFKVLTGDNINFGNFSCIPIQRVENIVSNPDAWNHYSSSVLKSKLPFLAEETDRGYRYFGKSKMNFANLVSHGLSSISLYVDIIGIRLLIFNIISIGVSFLLLLSLLFLKMFTSYEIPGWTPIYTLGIFNFLLLSSLFILLLVLIQLGNRNNIKLPPKSYYNNFILCVR